MRVLFLGIEGVLNSIHTIAQQRRPGMVALEALSLPMVGRLRTICAFTGAEVVVASTWSYRMDLPKLTMLFQYQGFDKELLDVIPDFQEETINAWIDQFNCNHAPDTTVEQYVVVATAEKRLGYCGGSHAFATRWVCTMFERGLQDTHVNQVLQLFGVLPLERRRFRLLDASYMTYDQPIGGWM